ncbi:rod shape-determining protein [Candidatus Woesebacteria bacterium]|nr:rod shape-determining protein [Candidatus Woesebacteria bacterium]
MRTRKLTLLQSAQQQWRRLTAAPLVVWDVGAVTTRVHVGQKLVFSQSSCIALNISSGQMVSQGDAAYRLLGNSGQHLAVVFPVDRSCIVDSSLARYWLTYVRTQLWPRRRWFSGLRAPAGILCLGESVGPADLRLWKSALESSGLATISPVTGLVGLSWYLNMATADEPCFVLDMGGSQTQIGIIVRGSLFKSKTVGWGGIALTTMIQTWLLTAYHCQVSWRVAEKLKCTDGSLLASKTGPKKTSIQGKDPYTQLGMTAIVEVNKLQVMMEESQQELVLFIRQFLASVPAEIATKCLENGLWIAGGSAQLDGVDSWLSRALGTPVSRVRDPKTATSMGIAIWAASQRAQRQKI